MTFLRNPVDVLLPDLLPQIPSARWARLQRSRHATRQPVRAGDCGDRHADPALRARLPFSLYVVADVHMECDAKKSYQHHLRHIPATEVLVIAGDLGNPNKRNFSQFLRACADRHALVVFVPGNHEHWHMDMRSLEALCDSVNVVMLQNGTLTYKGVTFVGSTFWTGLRTARGQPVPDADLASMNDTRHIPGLTRQKWLQWHERARAFVADSLARFPRCVVVTHHSPTFLSTRPCHRLLTVCGCYASHCDALFDSPSLLAWVHGHTHFAQRFRVGVSGALLLNNNVRRPDYSRAPSLHDADCGMLSQHRARDLPEQQWHRQHGQRAQKIPGKGPRNNPPTRTRRKNNSDTKNDEGAAGVGGVAGDTRSI
jgi:Icc-related predicted phosphoesterase